MDDEKPSDAVRLRALELAFLGILPFLSRDSLERAEVSMAIDEAPATGDERAAAKLAGTLFSRALDWHAEADDDMGLVGPDTPEDPEEIARFLFEVDRLIRIEAPEGPDADDLDRLAAAIVAVPSTIVSFNTMRTREDLAEAIRARAAQARGL